jgi:hypothetical protein
MIMGKKLREETAGMSCPDMSRKEGGMCSRHAEWSPESRSEAESGVMNRRAFLKISAAGVAGVTLLGSLGSAGALVPEDHPANSSVLVEFKEAAKEHGVPVELLMAMGWVNTRWEMPSPEANEYEKGDLHGWGSYGIMALVQNPFSDTLGEASRLTGIAEDELKTSRAANIRGGAALLASSLGVQRPSWLGGFFGAVAGRGRASGKNYQAVAGIGSGKLYAEQVFEALQRGVPEEKLKSGERLSLEARSLTDRIGAP